jgi:hypothetical protein
MRTLSRTIGPFTVLAKCSDDAAEAGEWLLETLERLSSRGLELRDGAVVRFGWVDLSLKQDANQFVICEPVFGAPPPGSLRADITTSLLIQGELLAVAKAVGVGPVFPYYTQRLLVAEGACGARSVVMSRLRPRTEHDSGWSVLAKDARGDEGFTELRVHELLHRQRRWMQALALPPGCVVEIEDGTIVAVGLGDSA